MTETSTEGIANSEKVSRESLLKGFAEDAYVRTLFSHLRAKKKMLLQIKGTVGSLDALLAAAAFISAPKTQLFILDGKEEARFFASDLQNLLDDPQGRTVLVFPRSYKKAYRYEETDNANVLMRAEVLNKISGDEPKLVVTYPEALCEKVISKETLKRNTFDLEVGEEAEISFLEQVLFEFNFEKTEFVHEAGQFAVRGGILDIYSYSDELPFRIEFWGDEIESIRSFDPETQLSSEKLEKISVIPNITHTSEEKEVRQSFLSFLPPDASLWFKDFKSTTETFKKAFNDLTERFEEIQEKTQSDILLPPEELFDKVKDFEAQAENFMQIEFGTRFRRSNKIERIEMVFEAKPQTDFHQDFKLLTDELLEHSHRGNTGLICSEYPKQLERLASIMQEVNPETEFRGVHLGLRGGFFEKHTGILLYTDHQIFNRYHRYKERKIHSKSKALTLKELNSLSIGDYVTHIDHGVGRFAGLKKVEHKGKQQEAIRLIYRDNDVLFVSLHSLHKIARYSGKDSAVPSLSKLGSPEWEKKKKSAKRKIKDIGKKLIKLYAKRRLAPGYAFTPDSYLQAAMESSFMYEDTPDQAKATEDVKADMEKVYPMDRLICGDVGFGKTEIAMRAAFKAVTDKKQVAVLVPTTVLAAQHARSFAARMKNWPVRIDYVNRFRKPAEIRAIKKDVSEGKIDILIGTHTIVGKTYQFKDLGLLVVDEEQKFGVKIKDKLKEMRVNVDCLTMTATPIPRTLQFSLLGARDLSVINTPPPNRYPVKTEVHGFDEVIIRDAVDRELRRGGQVFFVHNRIGDIEQIANIILRLVPDAKICVAHGQMKDDKLERAMMGFVNGEYDVMVSTNIIESGLDIPNANTMIINRAHMFGLSDLHQMRGRVGRSDKKAYCFLLSPALIGLSADARKRLRALEEFADLGDGFKIAMRDLDIRGAGNLLGAEQSGFINDLGFETYQKILDEAIRELKEKEFKDLFEGTSTTSKFKLGETRAACAMETDLEILIPETYVSSITERLNLYLKVDELKSDEDTEAFKNELSDRFGPVPQEVESLLRSVKLRQYAEKIGFEKLFLKGGGLKGYFPTENDAYFQSDKFGKVLAYVQQNPKRTRLKDTNKRLIMIVSNVPTIEEGLNVLGEVL